MRRTVPPVLLTQGTREDGMAHRYWTAIIAAVVVALTIAPAAAGKG